MENKKDIKEPILIAKNLNKIYINGEIQTHVVKEVNFSIYEGDFIVILGPSGSGKSTLMNLIGGMDSITSGELFYKNQAVHKFNKKAMSLYRRNVIGFVFQFYNLLPSLNCFENVSLSAELSKHPLPVKEILQKVGLEEREKHFPSQLSGGQQQRVALARAIVKSPEILLCDEPTGALDSQTSQQILELLREINKEYKKTVIVISHDHELLKFADRCLLIRDGYLTEKEEF
ncbi:ABC transporter ATP-binding protein [Tepidibacter aestuarii]|uniref:ABC transporter ATP-binding protein n=1 Tax=Tepidibacter aestuarii TaxID=2925782 RepID=UPI0020BEEE2B|nr:ABC transporter ATP-binding protein [Tepidibacter aestuarii]CAH2214748.1 lipoprotein release complex - ATP binding subunit [Tepidibacter aestuarii]